MPSFYPSLVVNLRVRFDESLHVVTAPEPQSTDDRLLSTPLDDIDRLIARLAMIRPLVTRGGDDNVSYVLDRVPKKGDVSRPGYRQAGQFNFTFDFRDLPIDPRTVRSAAVEVHLGAVEEAAFGRGMVAGNREGRRQATINTRDAAGEPNPETFYLAGTVDKWEATHGADGSIVTIAGRDWRGTLLDSKVGSNPQVTQHILDALDLSRPVSKVVAQLMTFHPMGDQFVIGLNPAEWPGEVEPAPMASDLIPRHRRGARGRRRSGRGNTRGDSTQLSYWDLIVNLCQICGAIPFFDRYMLQIRPSRSIFDQRRSGIDPATNPTPFRGGQTRDIDAQTNASIADGPLRVRRLVYGRDVSNLHFERTMGGGQRPSAIRCVSIDRSSTTRGNARVLTAIWPPRPQGNTQGQRARTTAVSPGGRQAQTEILNIPVPGITDIDRLQRIARSIYEEVGRGEMGGNCQTKNLSSFGGDNADPDLLRLGPGDGIEFLVDTRALSSRAPLVSALTDHNRASFEDQVRLIQERLGNDPGSENLARVIVATSRGQVAELMRFFRVANVKLGWDSSSGISISFDFQNYAVALFDVGDPAPTTAGQLERTSVNRGAT